MNSLIPTDTNLKALGHILMPHGPYLGKHFDEVPIPYLELLVIQDGLNEDLRSLLLQYLSTLDRMKE